MRKNERTVTAGSLCGFALALWLGPTVRAAVFNFSENFEGVPLGGIPAGWTATLAGTGTMGASNARSIGVGNQSMHMVSIPVGDRADLVGPGGVFNGLDFTQAYTADFDLNYDKTNDPQGFHFVEAFAMNGAGGLNHQVGLFLDRPNQVGPGLQFDELISRHGGINVVRAGVKEDVWYHLALAVNPGPATYNLTITDTTNGNNLFDPIANLAVNVIVVNGIPFILASQADSFFPFRFGDRNADGVFYDHGEAFWDNLNIVGTATAPEPSTVLLTAVGGVLLAWHRRRNPRD